MGQLASILYDAIQNFTTPRQAKILMLGLDGAGKTTLLYKLKLNETVSTIPTLGFNVETVQPTKSLSFTVWDVGGQEVLRPLWRHYFQNCDGLLYIVDSADYKRFNEAKEELEWILESEDMINVPLIVMANKQDQPQAKSPAEVSEKLGLNNVKNRDWRVQGTCAVQGEGVFEGITEFSQMVKEFMNKQR
ncbi:PREDICTED: ADP-ribosylation factor-like [Amphimedon queenslandica]|uniref:Uncharacterized protein n=1 Tax=Amphimedon queenslandica TaxID=400682 RepID=A0A1X7V937_AMPQE|nr:PREDICTED: ADP-ribosylation factor-like [Amphimedon queenslandica]|eukprot:XP_003385358.1 PREDICTED: ADP-ribosylation factor-like [Amphimedon queenslandica]